MNNELLRERESFKRKAMAVHDRPGSEKARKEASKDKEKDKNVGKSSSSAKAKLDLAHLKSMGGSSSQYKFGVLTRIVRHMKTRHMDGEDMPLTLEEILEETHQLDVGTKIRHWLSTEALKSNPKISHSTNMDGSRTTYLFKPPFSIMNKKGLVKLLRQYDLKGMGGIFLDDIQESLPKCDKVMKVLSEESNKIMVVTRPVDKKKVVFYHDHTADFEVDEEFARLWRSVAVDSVDDAKIDEYLEKQGIRSMQDQQQGMRKAIKRKPIKRNINRKKRAPKDNEHVAHDLEDYSEMTASAHQK